MTDSVSRPRAGPGSLRHLWHSYVQLAKLRLSGLVVVTTAAGFVLARPTQVNGAALWWTLLGTLLCAAGAAAFNQWLEVERDARMSRTSQRPLPGRQLSRRHALVWASVVSALGLLVLATRANVLSAALAGITTLLYAAIYTPLKLRSSFSTLVGSVVGALPPMVGWAAAAGRLEVGAWLLSGVLFLWQIPHFLALAWLYRRDYAAGGFAFLPRIDVTGKLTGSLAVLYSAALIPVALLASAARLSGPIYATMSLGLGVWLTWMALQLFRVPSDRHARRLFVASVIYLPCLLVLMVLDSPAVDTPAQANHVGAGPRPAAVLLGVPGAR